MGTCLDDAPDIARGSFSSVMGIRRVQEGKLLETRPVPTAATRDWLRLSSHLAVYKSVQRNDLLDRVHHRQRNLGNRNISERSEI